MLSAESWVRPAADVESGVQAGRIGRLYSLRIIEVCRGSAKKFIDTPGLEGLKSAIFFWRNQLSGPVWGAGPLILIPDPSSCARYSALG